MAYSRILRLCTVSKDAIESFSLLGWCQNSILPLESAAALLLEEVRLVLLSPLWQPS